jgi:enoyl-CoA hydratase
MLYELDSAFAEAAADPEIRVIILAADGPDFSSGHDLNSEFKIPGRPTATLQGDFDSPGLEGHIAFESEVYLGLCRRWREIPKPTIAQVQGRVIAGGLMLIWPLDLIVAADTATFTDPVTAHGGNGHEYFVHPYELGARKAKEFLFTGGSLTAHQAAALGMVNWVVPEPELASATLEVAESIASRPPFAIRMAKASVNRAQDAQGMQVAIDHAFGLHQLCQAVNVNKFGQLWDPNALPPKMKEITDRN